MELSQPPSPLRVRPTTPDPAGLHDPPPHRSLGVSGLPQPPPGTPKFSLGPLRVFPGPPQPLLSLLQGLPGPLSRLFPQPSLSSHSPLLCDSGSLRPLSPDPLPLAGLTPLCSLCSPPSPPLPLPQQPADENIRVHKADGPKKLSVEHIYQKKTQLEHILLRPDTYIGSVELVTQVGAAGSGAEPPEHLGVGGESLAVVL